MLQRHFSKRIGKHERSALAAVAALLAATTLMGCQTRFDADAAPSKILLISIDTTRADHLSAYGYGRPTTPFLKDMASRGVRAAKAFAVMPTTDPSHASILTGQYPRTHGIMRNAARRRHPKAPSVGTWLRKRGYRTAAITARVGLDPGFRGIAGFEHNDSPRMPTKARRADEIVKLATEWLSDQDGRWFLWVHLWEPHMPYEPRQPYRRRFVESQVPNVPRYAEPERFLKRNESLADKQIQRAKWLYDGEVATADAAVRKIVRAAYAAGPDDSSPLIMVVSDHGESMAERQSSHRIGFGHGVLLHNETVWVPWITVWEGTLARHVIETPVSLVDLAPTLMDLVQPETAYPTEGRSIAASLREGTQPEKRVFYLERRLFHSSFRQSLSEPENAVVDYPWKLIENEGSGLRELYRLDLDPLEKVDLVETETAVADRLGEQLAAWRRENPLPEQRGPKTRMSEQHQREREALRSLGYID